MGKILQKLDYVGVLLLVAAALYVSVTNLWDRWAIALAVLGGVSIVVGVFANYKQIMLTLGKRSTKYFTNYVVSVVLVLALITGVNFFGQRHSKRFDLTGIGRFTLAPQTEQILGKLKQSLEIKAFFPGGAYAPVQELLNEYRSASHQVHYEFIDADKNPEVAKQYGVTVYGTYTNPFTGSQLKSGTVVILYNGRQEKVEKRSDEVKEEDLTNAIIKIQRTESKGVYFVQGHGEKDPNKYYAMVDTLFRQQEQWVKEKPLPALLAIAKQAGFTEQSFEACLANQKLLDDIQKERQVAIDKYKVHSTPTFFIDGKSYAGAMTIEEMAKVIDPQVTGK